MAKAKEKPKTKKPSLSAADAMKQAKKWYEATISNPEVISFRERAVRAMGFYEGSGQWDQGVRALLEGQGKPVLTINRILPIVHTIMGTHLKNRNEITLYPKRNGTKKVAELGSELIKHTMDTCNGNDAASDAYRDGVVSGEGWLWSDRVFTNDPEHGDIEVQSRNPLWVYADPTNTAYDANKGEFLFAERFLPKAQLEAYFPKEAKDAMDAMTNDWSQDWVHRVAGQDQNFLNSITKVLCDNASYGELGASEFMGNGSILEGVCLRELWYKSYERITIAVTVGPQGQLVSARLETAEEKAKLKSFMDKNPGLQIEMTERVVTQLNLQVMVGDKLLFQKADPLNGMLSFPGTRFRPYHLYGHAFGVVEGIEGPQEEHNKMRSQTLHQLNQNGNPGWKAKKANDKGRRDIDAYGSTPGVLLETEDFGGFLERIEVGGISQGHLALAAFTAEDIQKISGVNPDLSGQSDSSSESGRAQLVRQEAGLTALAPMAYNMARTMSTFGTSLWEMTRFNDVWSPEEIFAVVDEDLLESMGGPRGAIEAMNDFGSGYYGVKSAPAPTSTTFREAQLEQLRELATFMANLGLQLPPDVAAALVTEALSLANFPGSDKIMNLLRASGPIVGDPQAVKGEASPPKPRAAGAPA